KPTSLALMDLSEWYRVGQACIDPSVWRIWLVLASTQSLRQITLSMGSIDLAIAVQTFTARTDVTVAPPAIGRFSVAMKSANCLIPAAAKILDATIWADHIDDKASDIDIFFYRSLSSPVSVDLLTATLRVVHLFAKQ
ncbi:MAG: hypothetical protein VYB65_00485, partial [Myxococcota bacterium]|nr:hypothetical protein [Myxococcota bacterium]